MFIARSMDRLRFAESFVSIPADLRASLGFWRHLLKIRQFKKDFIDDPLYRFYRHPTTCASIAEVMSVLFFDEMRQSLAEPRSPFSDRLVLSKVSPNVSIHRTLSRKSGRSVQYRQILWEMLTARLEWVSSIRTGMKSFLLF